MRIDQPAQTGVMQELEEGSRHARLSTAECVVLGFLQLGWSNKEIASALGKAEATIKHQVSSILHKHRVPSRARLIALLSYRP